MFSVLKKELRQFRHSQTLSVLFFLTVLLSAASFAVSKSPKLQDFMPQLLAGASQLFSGLFQLSVITIAGSRWKNENGDGSIDIVRTTPISPLQVTCAKITAAVAYAYPAYALSSIVTLAVFNAKISIWHMLITGLLQTTALCSLALGCATFQNKKRGAFDWAMVAVILALFPMLSVIFKGFTNNLSNADFILVDAELAAATALGISLCICGASPKSSDRAMALKFTVAASAVILPLICKYTTKSHVPLEKLFCLSMFCSAIFVITGALFERMKQSRRVLASPKSKCLFIFGTGVVNSLALFTVFAAALLIISGFQNTVSQLSILAKILFFTGICQLTRNKKAGNFPVLACIITAVLVPISAICREYLPEHQAWIPELFILYSPCSAAAAVVFAIAGAALYAPVCIEFYKQYFKKVDQNG